MTITQPKRITDNRFLCLVKRPLVFNVFWQPARWEIWIVLADSHKEAMNTAKYHFYRSADNEIFVTNNPIN